jgi:dATP pyrophosphohydrolase
MPDMVSDIVDVYVFRRLSARVQFLLLQRRANVPLGNTWQSFHTQIRPEESTIVAGRRAVRELAGLNVSEVYSADYINEFYDDMRDVVVLAPVLAVNVSPQAPVTLGPEFRDCAWWDTSQAVARLPFAGQRWAVRHIDEIMSIGHAESQLYRLQLPTEDPRPFDDNALAAIRQSDETPGIPDGFESFTSLLDGEPSAAPGDPEELPVTDESGHRTNVP